MLDTINNSEKINPFNIEVLTPEEIDSGVESGIIQCTLFSGGCFWGPDSFFGSLEGVIQTRVGYAGSVSKNPSYSEFKGHAETVRVYFDPLMITYRDLLREFTIRYYNDRRVGQYRTILFTSNNFQKKEIQHFIATLKNVSNLPEVIDLNNEKGKFWPAEDYHQKYRLRRNKTFLPFLEDELGERWDEHAFATKLNASSETDFDVTPWVESFSEKAKGIFRIQ